MFLGLIQVDSSSKIADTGGEMEKLRLSKLSRAQEVGGYRQG